MKKEDTYTRYQARFWKSPRFLARLGLRWRADRRLKMSGTILTRSIFPPTIRRGRCRTLFGSRRQKVANCKFQAPNQKFQILNYYFGRILRRCRLGTWRK